MRLPGAAKRPALQSSQTVAPSCSAMRPVSQSRHAVCPVEGCHLPRAQRRHAVVLGEGATRPAGPKSHAALLALPAKRPTAQGRQKVDLGCQVKRPASQATHVDRFTFGPKVPSGQSVQFGAAGPLKVPVGHSSQEMARFKLYHSTKPWLSMHCERSPAWDESNIWRAGGEGAIK